MLEPLPLPNKIYLEAIPLTVLPNISSMWPIRDFTAKIRRPIDPVKASTRAFCASLREADEKLGEEIMQLEKPKERRKGEPPIPIDSLLDPMKQRIVGDHFTIVSELDDDFERDVMCKDGDLVEDVMKNLTEDFSGTKNVTDPDGEANLTISNFLRGCSNHPTAVAQLRGAELIRFNKLPEAQVPEVAWEGLAKQTHVEHLRYLNTISVAMSEESRSAPLATAILETIMFLKQQRGWMCSTTLKTAASIQGCLSLLPLYKKGASRITLTQDVVWQQGMRTMQRACKEETPNQPVAATLAQVYAMVDHYLVSPRVDIAVALLLGWVTAARLGCILQLKKNEVVFNEDKSLTVKFMRGKGVRARGPYTVHVTWLPQHYFNSLRSYMEKRHANVFSNALKGHTLRVGIKRVCPDLEQRSMRRGALQNMARSGVSEETMMNYSGHTRVQTLRRYLNWNSINSAVQVSMQKAGATLVPQEPSNPQMF